MMSFSKNPVHFQKPRPFSKTPAFYQNPVHFQKPRPFQKPRSFSKTPVIFKNSGLLSKTRVFQKPRSFIKKPGFSTETWVFKATQKLFITHSSHASILKCLSITGESLMFG